MKKPDRFERVVKKLLERDGTIYHHEVTDLLRKEHAWVRRIIKSEPELPGSMPDHMWAAVRHDREMMEELLRSVARKTKENILAQLDQRRK